MAALEAAEALAHTHYPVVRSVLERIARDEQATPSSPGASWPGRSTNDPSSRAWSNASSSSRRKAHRPATSEGPSQRRTARVAGAFDLLPHGILTDTERVAVRAATWRDVVQPCASRLLAQS